MDLRLIPTFSRVNARLPRQKSRKRNTAPASARQRESGEGKGSETLEEAKHRQTGDGGGEVLKVLREIGKIFERSHASGLITSLWDVKLCALWHRARAHAFVAAT